MTRHAKPQLSCEQARVQRLEQLKPGERVYTCTPHGMARVKVTTQRGVPTGVETIPLCSFWARVATVYTEEDGSRFFRIVGESARVHPDGTRRTIDIEVSEARFNDPKRLYGALLRVGGSGFFINLDCRTEVVRAIRFFTNGDLNAP